VCLQSSSQEGDHVKVVAGQMSGETGMILQLIDNIATLFLDSSRKEVKLFTRDLTESADIVAGIDRCAPADPVAARCTCCPCAELVQSWQSAVM
jgi:transcription elongation factor